MNEYLKTVEEVGQRFGEYAAEIQRLNTVIGVLEAAAKRDIELIAELCDALEDAWRTGAVNTGTPPLIQRAREATR